MLECIERSQIGPRIIARLRGKPKIRTTSIPTMEPIPVTRKEIDRRYTVTLPDGKAEIDALLTLKVVHHLLYAVNNDSTMKPRYGGDITGEELDIAKRVANMYRKANAYHDLDEVQIGRQDLWIDFDLSASIKEDNGVYYLKPTMKAYGMLKYGRIAGKVLPKDARVVIKAYIGKDTTTAIPEDGSGSFKIRGLIDGNYSVLVKSYNGYKDTTITNIMVQKGKETSIPLITLHK